MATRDLATNSLKSLDKADRIISSTSKELIDSYKAALADVRSKLAALYSQFLTLEEPTKAQLTQFMRLSNIEKEIVATIKPYLTANEALLKDMSVLGVDAGFFNNAWAVDQATGVSQSWGLIDDASVRAAAGIGGDAGELTGLLTAKEVKQHQKVLDAAFVNYNKDTAKWISQDIRQGIIQGESVQEIAKRLRDSAITKSYNSAMVISRTETLRATGIGNQIAYDQARDAGVQIVETWDATLDDRTRADHASADGTERDNVTGMYSLFGTEFPGPRRSGIAAQDINCFPGFVNVTADKIENAYKREYSGKVHTIKTAGKLNFTVTPNHPILTMTGWVRAGLVNIGDQCISMSNAELINMSKPNIENLPASFEKIYDFLSISNSCVREAGIDKQFHGDGRSFLAGRESDVNIVSRNSELLDANKPLFREHFKKGIFAFTEILFGFFPSLGSLHQLYDMSLLSEDSIMGFLGECESIIRRHISHSDIHAIASASEGQIEFTTIPGNNITGYIEAFSSSLARFSEMISFDKVVRVTESEFNGHVYNLQTNSGWYIVADNEDEVNGIIAHNCRCISVGEVAGLSPEQRALRDEGMEPYQSFESWAIDNGLTTNRFGDKYNFNGSI